MLKEYSTVIIEISYNDNLLNFCFFQKAWNNFEIALFPPLIKMLGGWSINGVFNFRFLSFDSLEAEEEVFDGREYTLWNISKQRFIKTGKTKTVVFDKFYCWSYLWYEVSHVWLNRTFVKQDGSTLRTLPTRKCSLPPCLSISSQKHCPILPFQKRIRVEACLNTPPLNPLTPDKCFLHLKHVL